MFLQREKETTLRRLRNGVSLSSAWVVSPAGQQNRFVVIIGSVMHFQNSPEAEPLHQQSSYANSDLFGDFPTRGIIELTEADRELCRRW